MEYLVVIFMASKRHFSKITTLYMYNKRDFNLNLYSVDTNRNQNTKTVLRRVNCEWTFRALTSCWTLPIRKKMCLDKWMTKFLTTKTEMTI